jgi:hypothetical protein
VTKLTFTLALAALAAGLLLAGCGGGSESAEPGDYHVEINNGWNQFSKDKKIGGYIESAWRDPESPIIAIDTRASDETGSPMASADLARVQTSGLPGYRDLEVKPQITLGGHQMVQWGFHTADERAGYDLFFEDCGISFIVRGTMGTRSYWDYVRAFREMAKTIKADC